MTAHPNTRRIVCLAVASSLWPSLSVAGLFGPSNYDECILESMKGVTSDLAARAIGFSCRKKFPVEKPGDAELPVQALAKVTGSARVGYGFGGGFGGTIYNGNSDYTVTQITIVLIPNKSKSAYSVLDQREYNVDVIVSPLTNSSFNVSVETGDAQGFSWNITRARGYK